MPSEYRAPKPHNSAVHVLMANAVQANWVFNQQEDSLKSQLHRMRFGDDHNIKSLIQRIQHRK